MKKNFLAKIAKFAGNAEGICIFAFLGEMHFFSFRLRRVR